MISLIILTTLLLVSIASIRPNRSSLSEFELNRRLEAKLPGAKLNWYRRELYTELMTIRRIMVAFFLVVTSALIIAKLGWAWGLAGSFGLILTYSRLAAFRPLHGLIQSRFDYHEPGLLRWIDKHRRLIKPLRGVGEQDSHVELGSRQELLHIVDGVEASWLSRVEKKMIHGALDFGAKRAKDYMTPRSQMEAIGVNELLGPLVLDDLHKTGHSHFPVFDGDIDRIVGVLHLHNIFTLIDKRTITVGDAMEPKVLYINENQPLDDVLSVCIKHRRHLLVVVNEREETVGVITIEDAVSQLIGRAIVDSGDDHDNRQKVAARNT